MTRHPSTKAKQRQWLDNCIAQLEALTLDLRTLRAELHNRRPVTRGQVTAASVTAEKRRLVLRLHKQHPEWNYEQLARASRLDNIGRISGILAGIRT